MQTTLTSPSPSMEKAAARRETFERAAIVARDYAALARRQFSRAINNAQAEAELADQICKNEVALDGGCDAVLLRYEELELVLRNLRCLEVSTDRLPETILIDVTAQIDDEPHVDAFELITWERWAIVNRHAGAVEIRCRPTKLEEVYGRWLLTLDVEGTVKS